jgi:signal transduction histidine kinase
MRLGTRLLLPLLGAVAAVMTIYAVWAVRQREVTLTAEAHRETHAYAIALGLAMESAFRDPYLRDVQEIIDRLSRERTIYGVLVYDFEGDVLLLSDPLTPDDAALPGPLREVLATGVPASLERTIDGEAVYSVLRPIHDPLGKVLGAFEVAQPLSFLRAEIASTRQRFLLNTLTLLLAITFVTLALVRSLVARPVERFVAGARALARGELGHRVGADPGARELRDLAEEFNRMAGHLEAARYRLVREGEERILLERRLRETEKLAAAGNIAAGLAHEIGAPLHVIRGRAEMLLRRNTVPQAERRNLRIIVEQIERITRIVQNLLDFTRRREPRIETVDVAALVRDVAEFLDGEFDRSGVTFSWEGPPALYLRGDANLLHQVFINLFVNALQALEHSRDERHVVVRARIGRDPAPGAAGMTAILEVEDSGPGIQPELLDGVFEPFFTTKASGDGTGLGLAVARSIIEEHGGHITAVDRAATGTGTGGALFRIVLPATTAPAPAHA